MENLHPRKLTRMSLRKGRFQKESSFQSLFFRGHVSVRGSNRLLIKMILINFNDANVSMVSGQL